MLLLVDTVNGTKYGLRSTMVKMSGLKSIQPPIAGESSTLLPAVLPMSSNMWSKAASMKDSERLDIDYWDAL